MKHTKRLMSIILSLVMILSITAGLDFSSYANQDNLQNVHSLKDVSDDYRWGCYRLYELNVKNGGVYKFYSVSNEYSDSCHIYTKNLCSDEDGEWYEPVEMSPFSSKYNFSNPLWTGYFNLEKDTSYYIELTNDRDMYFCQIPDIQSSQLEFVSAEFDTEYAFIPDTTGYYCFNYPSDYDKMINCGSNIDIITDEEVNAHGYNGKTIAKLTKGNPYVINFQNNYADFETETECSYKLSYEKLPDVLSVKVIKSAYGENEPLIQDVSTSGGSDNGNDWKNYEYIDRFYLEVKFDNGKTVVTHNSDDLFGYEIECDDDQKTNWQAGEHSAIITVGDKSDKLNLNMVSKEDFVKNNFVSLGENKIELLNIGKPNASYSKKRVAFKPTESGTYCISTKSNVDFTVYDTDWDNTDSYNGNVVSRLEKDKIYVIELYNYYYDNPANSVVLNIERVADVKNIEVLNAKYDDNYFINQFYPTDDLQVKVTYDNDKSEIIKLGDCEKSYSQFAEPTYYYKNLYINCFSAINHYECIDVSCNTVKTTFEVKASRHIVNAELIKQPYDNKFSGGSMKLYFSDGSEMLFEKTEFLSEYFGSGEIGGDTILKSSDGTMLICYIEEVSKADKKYELKFHSFPDEVVVDTSFEFSIDDYKCVHSWNTGVVNKKSTCTSTGVKIYTCTECGETKTETIPIIAHNYKTTTTKATTKKNGSIVTKCSVCGNVKSNSTICYPKTITLSATSYTYDGKVKKPTVTVKDSKGKKIASSNYTVTYSSGRKNVGTYTVTITFKGNYSGTIKKTFTIKPKATTLSKVTAGKKAFTVKWKKQATQTTGYQIQYSTSSKFKNAKTVTVSKNKTTSKKISKLKAKKKYYVRVRTYKTVKVNGKNTKIYSGWSKAKTVKTK